MPALTVTVNIEGKDGEDARIPFAVHDPQPGLANADRPVWVLAATYPRLAGSSDPGGAETSNAEDLLLRPAEAGQVGRSRSGS